MRNLHLEATLWNLFTSTEFFEAAARECDGIVEWFGVLAISRQVSNFGRNNQIYDKFKQRASDFRRGAEMAQLGDYQLIWKVASYISGDIRGIMEQPLHSWMTAAEFQEFESVRIGRLLNYATQITLALHNGMVGANYFFHPNPNCPERSNDDDGFPGDKIAKAYESHIEWYKERAFWKLPNPLPEYVVDRSIACNTGDEVPWTGVWFPATGLERHSLTFAIKGLRMQPVYRVIKTPEELRTEEDMFPSPETVAVPTAWHPVIPSGRPLAPADKDLRAKAGQPCPKAGLWQALAPGSAPRYYETDEPMADLQSAYGYTVWSWLADR